MALDALKSALPGYAGDLRRNLTSVVDDGRLPERQLWGALLACAIAVRSAAVLRAVAPEALAACIAGHRSPEPGHTAALTKLGLRPLIDLDLRLGEGTGALLALPLVQSAARAMHEVATFDAAGVTEKG